MAKKEGNNLTTILNNIADRRFSPIYLLQGEEGFFIDQITQAITSTLLTEDERDFNERILFGGETDVFSLMSEARYYPSFADHRLVVVKEAQQMRAPEELVAYAKNPTQTTVLVLCFKGGKVDGRSTLAREISKAGVLFESKRLYDSELPRWIQTYTTGLNLKIETEAIRLLAEFIGNDLNRISGEIEKLRISLSAQNPCITADAVQERIGISKEFNPFELLKAIANKDFFLANRIAFQMSKNPKANPFPLTLSLLFNFFQRLLLAHYHPNKSEQSLQATFGLNYYQAQDLAQALRRYPAGKTFRIIRFLRQIDARFKGFESNSIDEYELLQEMIFFLFA